jgi:REP element-mobilizing transposase RayT
MNEDKYKGIYRIPSARWRDWDYGANAAYYVTICTAHCEHFFGEIVADAAVETQNFASLQSIESDAPQMQLSEIGRVAHDCWMQIPAHFPFVALDAFVVMPNHVHGIIIIDKSDNDADANCRDAINRVSTSPSPTASPAGGVTGDKNPMLHSNLSRILRWYKGRVAFESRQISAGFAWQTRFHDRVIRDYAEHARIAQYINTNIQNWKNDELYESNK